MIKLFEHYRNGERVYSKIVEPVCKRYNLNHMEFTILMFLYNNPEYDSAKDIVSYKKLTKSHVSLGIKSLSDKGLLYQHIDTSNKKLIHLCLSDEAKDIAKEGRLYQEKFQNISLSGFSDSEVDLLLSFIDRINNNINNYK